MKIVRKFAIPLSVEWMPLPKGVRRLLGIGEQNNVVIIWCEVDEPETVERPTISVILLGADSAVPEEACYVDTVRTVDGLFWHAYARGYQE